MRISHKNKFIFFAIPKTGSTSVRMSLDTFYNAHDIPEGCGDYIKSEAPGESPFYHHGSAQRLKEEFVRCKWNWDDYFKFTFVRNPWARLVSFYFYYKQDVGYAKQPKNKPPSYLKMVKSAQTGGFTSWVAATQNEERPQQNQQVCGEKNLFVGKSENLQEDFNTVCDKIGIPRQQLPHKNKSNHKHYTEYYDEETKQIVAEKYAEDIEAFGYEFGK